MRRIPLTELLVVVIATLVPAAQATAEEIEPETSATEVPRRVGLDLRLPPLAALYTEQEIAALLAPTFTSDLEVEVRGKRVLATPRVWPGIAAPVWALLNPADSWRILAPLPPEHSAAVLRHAADTSLRRPVSRSALDL